MNRWMTLLLLFVSLGCASVPVSRGPAPEETFFDASTVESFVPGTSTRQDVRAKMGKAFIDVPTKDGRVQWIYMYTTKRQYIFTFEGDRLVETAWSEEYGSPIRASNE